jgi:methylmalonyl-CoA/ethylmalonyl-CoA epimerase
MAAATAISTTGLYQVAQPANDLERAIGFYRDVLGLPLLGKWDPPGLALFDIGGTRLMLSGEGGGSAVIYLRVDNLEHTVEVLRGQGVTIEHEPHVIFKDTQGLLHPAGTEEWMAFIRDSEQNMLGLVATILPPE